MPGSAAPRLVRKRRDRYHHGDLRRALLQAAVRLIQLHGTDALTLRAVGSALGVSRTALYRHFTDKSALLAAVAAEGFRMLRAELVESWEAAGKGRGGFEAMGLAYVRFAVSHPAHYRVMFASAVVPGTTDADLAREGAAAFHALVDAIIEQQGEGLVRPEDPTQMARYIWAVVHGIAMLALDGRLQHQGSDSETLTHYAIERIRSGIAPKT